MSELLVELSIAVHRYAMYPDDHPSLGPSVENTITRLGEIFVDGRRNLVIGVAETQLIIEGVPTDPKHLVLSDLARRLHAHQLAALSFSEDTRPQEVRGLLSALSKDARRDAEPLALMPEDERPSWTHIRIFPIGYDHLGITGGPEQEVATNRATLLWFELVQASMMSEKLPDQQQAEDPSALARRIREQGHDEAYEQVIVGYLRALTEELRRDESGEAQKIRRRLNELIAELDDTTMERLLAMAGDQKSRKQFLMDANHALAVDAVMKVLQATSTADKQPISSSFTRLLSKLSKHATDEESAVQSRADTALRDNVEDLLATWDLEDPNPDQYSAVLDAMARANPIFNRGEGEKSLPGAERIVQMALEVDAWGVTVERAVLDMIDQHTTGRLLTLIEGAGVEIEVAEKIRDRLSTPEYLERLLSGDDLDDLDEVALHDIVERIGERAIAPLLEVLAESDSRSVRRKVFDGLASLGPEVARRAIARLDDPRWFVVRNMLALLVQLDEVPEDFDPLEYTWHSDMRVRRAAFVLAFKIGASRARTLAAALGEDDERLIRMALAEVQDELPESLVPTVVNRVVRSEHPPEIRALAIRTLSASRSRLVREALLDACSDRRSIFGKAKLLDASPAVFAALDVLRSRWAEDEACAAVLDEAARSKDSYLRMAEGGEVDDDD